MSDKWQPGCLYTLGLVLSLLPAGQERGTAGEPEIPRRGLIAVFRDNAQPKPAEVTRLEPTVALALQSGEAPHPRLGAEGGSVVWLGQINIVRAGSYRFAVQLRGRLRLLVADKEVLASDNGAPTPVRKEGAEVSLPAGMQTLVAEFTRLPGVARVELLWKGPGFREEPLPHDVVGHLAAQEPARLKADAVVEHGRFLIEELSCVKCHKADESNKIAMGLGARLGPDLSQVGKRVYAGWIYRWLESPRTLRPGSVMPELFSADEAGRVERFAVTRFLVSLGGPVQASLKPPKFDKQISSILRGRALFASTGCIACHGESKGEQKPVEGSLYGLLSPTGPHNNYPFSGLASKTTPELLAQYLTNPLAIDPSGRMPQMMLTSKEAEDLAQYLCQSADGGSERELPAPPAKELLLAAFKRVEKRADELTQFERLRPDAQWQDLGKRLVIDRGCNNCHTIAPGGKPFAAVQADAELADLRKKDRQQQGCLAEQADKRGQAPWFGLPARDREALRAFLDEGLSGAGSPALANASRLNLKRFNCLACHTRDGEGGLQPDQIEQLRALEKAENAETVSPPPLTGVGHKLRTAWLRQVLTGAGRARPWMSLRMPQFGADQVGKLPEGLAALEGADSDDTIHKVALTPTQLEAGRQLVGKAAFGCISCHDLAGIPNSGTRGPDLATSNQRVRHEWYLRWLEQPQRQVPGTKMPAVFLGGKTLLDTVLDGSAPGQAEAMWGYMALASTMPLPEGMEPPKGLVLAVQDRPLLLRTFMPDAGTRAIAVGFPRGVSLAFDAQTGRLAYGWSGHFLDAAPVWGGRGGNPAKIMGTRFWTAPPGCPVGLSPNSESPDFLNRAKDPAYGGPLPEGKTFDGTPLLRFQGYTTDKAGMPTFRYEVETSDSGQVAEVREHVEPLLANVAAGLKRDLTLHVPPRQNGWLLVGQTSGQPRLLDAKGAPLDLDLKGDLTEVPARERMLVLPQDGDRVVVLILSAGPEHSTWQLKRKDGVWQALLRLPPLEEKGNIQVELKVWVPFRDDPAFLKGLVGSK